MHMPDSNRVQTEFLHKMALRYIWWMSPEQASKVPYRIIAQVMNIGTWEDALILMEIFPPDALKHALKNAEAGWFRPRSWHFWHYRLGLADVGKVPPLPVRRGDSHAHC